MHVTSADLAEALHAEALHAMRLKRQIANVADHANEARRLITCVAEHLDQWITDGGWIAAELLADPAADLSEAIELLLATQLRATGS
jgi:N-acetylglucosamine kinase-like BadF-type ATPase